MNLFLNELTIPNFLIGDTGGHMLKSNQKMLLNVKSNPEPQMEGGGRYICTLRRFFRQLLEKLLVYKLHFRDL